MNARPNDYDQDESIESKITRLETQMGFVLKAIDAPREIKQIANVPELKTFMGFSEERIMRWLVIGALGLAAGGNLQTLLANLVKGAVP